jgi:hypothetical protein
MGTAASRAKLEKRTTTNGLGGDVLPRAQSLDAVDTSHNHASYVDGVLTIGLTKRAEAKPKRIPISTGPKALGGGKESSRLDRSKLQNRAGIAVRSCRRIAEVMPL